MEDKILFIMPSINRDTIKRSVQSLKAQTDERWHLCIVYDNVDNPIIQDEKQITCINLDKKLGSGENEAGLVRNVAINKFQNQYRWIGFIDDDDYIGENYVKLLFCKYHQHDLVIFKMQKGDEVIPPSRTQEISKYFVGISFCFKTPVLTRFMPDTFEDFHFLKHLQIEKSKKLDYVITEEIAYYVNGATQ